MPKMNSLAWFDLLIEIFRSANGMDAMGKLRITWALFGSRVAVIFIHFTEKFFPPFSYHYHGIFSCFLPNRTSSRYEPDAKQFQFEITKSNYAFYNFLMLDRQQRSSWLLLNVLKEIIHSFFFFLIADYFAPVLCYLYDVQAQA